MSESAAISAAAAFLRLRRIHPEFRAGHPSVHRFQNAIELRIKLALVR